MAKTLDCNCGLNSVTLETGCFCTELLSRELKIIELETALGAETLLLCVEAARIVQLKLKLMRATCAPHGEPLADERPLMLQQRARISWFEALIGNIRAMVGAEIRNVEDICVEQHEREIHAAFEAQFSPGEGLPSYKELVESFTEDSARRFTNRVILDKQSSQSGQYSGRVFCAWIGAETGVGDEVGEKLCTAIGRNPDTGDVEIVHQCPPDGRAVMPCCSRTPFELSRGTSRMTNDPALVTCKGDS